MLVEAGLIDEKRVFEISFDDFERLEAYHSLSSAIKELKRENKKTSSLGDKKKGGLSIRPNAKGNKATVKRGIE